MARGKIPSTEKPVRKYPDAVRGPDGKPIPVRDAAVSPTSSPVSVNKGDIDDLSNHQAARAMVARSERKRR